MKPWATVMVVSLSLSSFRSALADDQARSAVVVQLFTSEGCSSCPPADALLSKLANDTVANGVTIIPMSMHVDYWNHLGWRDPYSSSQFSAIQQQYQRTLRMDAIYTPQMVVDGRTEFIGSDRTAAETTIAAAAGMAKANVRLQIDPSQSHASMITVKIDVGHREAIPPNEACNILVAITEDELSSAVRQGENAGRTLHHTAVVRSMQSFGAVASAGEFKQIEKQVTLDPSWKREHLHIIAIVQSAQNLTIYGAGTTSLPASDKSL